MRIILRLVGLVLLLSTAPLAQAQAAIVIGANGQPSTDLSPHLSILVDPSAKLSIHEILAGDGGKFVPNTSKTPSFGFTEAAVWLRIELQSSSDQTERMVMNLASTRLSHFTWFVVNGGRVERTVESGAADTTREQFNRLPTLELEIPARATRTIYARAESETSIWLPLHAGSPQEMARRETMESALHLLQIGFCGALVLLSTFVGISQRQSLYFYLPGFVISYVFYTATFNGFSRMAWPGIPLWFERDGFGLICSVGSYVFVKFNSVYLNMSDKRRTARILQRAAELSIILSILFFLTLDFSHAIQLWNPLLILGLVVEGLAIASRTQRKYRPEEVWFLVTWVSLSISIGLICLQFLRILPVLIPFDLLQRLTIPTILAGFFLSIIARQRSLQELELRLSEARQAESNARLSALRYQINPHFLFNTLSSIDALSRTSPSQVPGMVSRLATFLRLRLEPSPTQLSSFERELEATRAYLDIEHTRFGDALTATYDIAPESLAWQVPELILQPLVENAVKYGFENDCQLEIQIQSRVNHGILTITVSNRGTLPPENEAPVGFGIGIHNIRQRLTMHYGVQATFQLSQQGENVVALLLIPKL
jgi:hypothetical protein